MHKSESLKEIKLLLKVAKKKQFKPFWVVAELYKKYGQKYVLSENVSKNLSKELKVSKERVKWFVEEVLSSNSKLRKLRPI